MKIIWRDIDLNSHEIDLSKAVDVKIEGLVISPAFGGGIKVCGYERIALLPASSNVAVIKER